MKKMGIHIIFLFLLLILSSNAFSRLDEEAQKEGQDHVHKPITNYGYDHAPSSCYILLYTSQPDQLFFCTRFL